MDDTQASLKVADASAATRKRRSSILKSQRPPRTPFSELEFNVATPTDTAKSRRVSFSRRTGVAEFVTNEATTTWKNFYEEHNKSLESSGNESAANAPRPVIGHIGKRIFDQQFEEVEVIDIGGTLQTNTAVHEFQTSLNNINFTQQFAALECTGDDKNLCAPQQNFDLSALTDHHTKVFGDELSVPVMTEMSNPININFSNLQPIGSNSKCDDLEEIQRDLERSNPSNVVCQGPFSGGRDLSEYIEIDLNMTNVGVRIEDCDMSITDTIPSPKVQEVLKSNTSINKDKKSNKNWVVDKENIVINPYTTPKESLNFAINEASDEVLVFDGKKLTLQSEKKAIDVDNQDNVPNKLPVVLKNPDVTPKRKTIILNTNDDLPNFIPDSSLMINQSCNDIVEVTKSVIYNDFDLSITQAVDNKIEIPKRKTIVFEDDMGNISITQAVPAKVIIDEQEMRKTILYENDITNLSITQAVPTNIISSNKSIIEKRKTILYEDGDISFTRALPANLILNENSKLSQDKTVYFQDGLDISITQAIPKNIITSTLEKIESVKNDLTNLSITQAIPSNIISIETKNTNVGKTVIYDNNQDADIDTTQVVSDNILFSNKNNSEKRKTIVYEQEAGNISITQAVPTNILFSSKNDIPNTTVSKIAENAINKSLFDFEANSKSIKIQNNEKDTIKNTTIYDDQAEVSFTKVMPTNILQFNVQGQNDTEITSCDNDISITRALPTNILLQVEEQIKDKILEPISGPIPANANKTVNEDISTNAICNISKILQESKFYNNDLSNLSMTKPIPTEILTIQNELSNKCEIDMYKCMFKDNDASVNQDVLIYQTAEDKTTKLNKSDHSKIEDDTKCTSTSERSDESIKHDLSYNLNQSALEKQSIDKSVSNIIKKDKKCEEKLLERESLNEMELMSICTHKSAVVPIEQNIKPKKSILNELLDMSCASSNEVNENPVLDNIEVNSSGIKIITDNIKSTGERESHDSIFVIRDSENDLNIENIKDNENCTKDNRQSSNKSPKISYQTQPLDDKEEMEQDLYLQQKVDELKSVNEENKKSINRHYEKVLSSDIRKSIEILDKSNVKNDHNISRCKKSFKYADDTKELLEMLSDFTDGQADVQEKNKSVAAIDIQGSATLGKKSEPTRFSIIPKRQSIALSREDLLNNISMAQAALQQSRFEIDDSGSIEDTHDSPEEEEDFQIKQSPKKSVRMSMEVVKTLQFEEDDSVADVSMNANIEISPLKKPTFGEAEYVKEDKAKVIPSYLKDVSDGIKALMHDLVKPMADMMPNETELNKTKNSSSTCSTQIQANLITSSQIDIDVELQSTGDSVANIQSNQSIVTEVAALGNKAVTNELRQSIKPVSSHVSLEIERKPTMETKIKVSFAHQSIPGPVILFDHNNPLNNILLTQSDCTKVHKYNPLSPSNVCKQNEKSIIDDKNKDNKFEVENISMQYNVESRLSRNQSMLQSGDAYEDKTSECNIVDLNVSKPLSVDQSTEGLVRDLKDTEVNTLIAMKANQDLLESNSSLTLVDDALAKSAFDVKIESAASSDKAIDQKSPLRVIYKMDTDEEQLHKMDSDFTSNDEFEKEDLNENSTITRKRSYSPTKQDKHRLSRPNVDITPKPLSKMQKISNSPQMIKTKDRDHLYSPKIEPNDLEKSPNKSKLSPNKKTSAKKRNSPKREDVITVQQLISECYRDSIDQKIDKHILEALKESPSESLDTETLSRTIVGVKSTDTVSLNSTKEMEDVKSVESQDISVVGSKVSRVDWQPEVIDELSSKNLLTECSSSANVVAKIDTLPFMGSRECEWESSGGDVWMFRLLRTRIRLTIRLAHSHHNASRSRVRADTALVAVTVDPIQDEKDPLAALCVRLAVEAMRYECSRSARAGDVPALLRRSVAIARVALRWARAMRDARLRLAYNITPEGELTLKVANVPLRAVWEVRLEVELVAEEHGPAWPRAGHVRAAPVLAAAPAPPPARLARLADRLPRDWGHVPAVLWKVFRYLKNKTREDDLLGL